MRASVLTIRGNEYIEAAKAINAKNGKIIVRHIITQRNGTVDC